MKKRLTATILFLTMLLTLWVGAALRYVNFISVEPDLSFSGTTANCLMEIEAEEGVKFTATMILYHVEDGDDVWVKEWGTSGVTSLEHEGTRSGLISGETYKLTVRASANGETVTKSVTATCP